MKIDEIKTIVEQMGEDLKPKEDWPALIFLSREDEDKKAIFISSELMNSEYGKDIAAQRISEAIRINRATRCAMVATAWLTTPDSGKKHEIVLLLFCDGPTGKIFGYRSRMACLASSLFITGFSVEG